MKITKHGNKYRIQVMSDGIRHNISFDHYPNQVEISKAIAQISGRYTNNVSNDTFRNACETYIQTKSNVLSPSTVRSYYSLMRIIPNDFMEKRIMSITQIMVQKVVNDYAIGHSPKTVSNYAHFITGVLTYSGVNLNPPQLPQKQKKEPYIPSVDDVKAILEQIRIKKYEIPLMLTLFGLRRSEVCALTIDDLNGNELTVNKAKVQGPDNEWVIKTTKTIESTRTVIIPDDLAEKIREQGYIYNGHPELLYRALQEAQTAAGVPNFPLHKMRHFFASYAHQLGYSDKQIQSMGGWTSTSSVMKSVYQHAMEIEQAKKGMANDLGKIIK